MSNLKPEVEAALAKCQDSILEDTDVRERNDALEALGSLRTALTTAEARSNDPSVPEWVALGERCEAAEARIEAALAVLVDGKPASLARCSAAAILRGETL
jgi:hypothetical protein